MLKVCEQAEKDQLGEQLAALSDTVEAKISQPVLSMTDQMREKNGTWVEVAESC